MLGGLPGWRGGGQGGQGAVSDGWHAGVELPGVAEELLRPLLVAFGAGGLASRTSCRAVICCRC